MPILKSRQNWSCSESKAARWYHQMIITDLLPSISQWTLPQWAKVGYVTSRTWGIQFQKKKNELNNSVCLAKTN